MKTKQLHFTLKVNLGNYETMEVSQSVELEDGESEGKSFAELTVSVLGKCGKVVKLLGRESEVVMASKFPNLAQGEESQQDSLKTIDEFMDGNQETQKPVESTELSFDDLANYGKE